MIKIFVEAKAGDRTIRKKVIPADIFNQAFAYDHLLPAQDFQIGTTKAGGAKPKHKPKKDSPAPAAQPKPSAQPEKKESPAAKPESPAPQPEQSAPSAKM